MNKRKEDKLRSAAPLGPFSVLVIASRGKMVEYYFLSLARTPSRCTKSVGLQIAFRRVLFALKHSARRRFFRTGDRGILGLRKSPRGNNFSKRRRWPAGSTFHRCAAAVEARWLSEAWRFRSSHQGATMHHAQSSLKTLENTSYYL